MNKKLLYTISALLLIIVAVWLLEIDEKIEGKADQEVEVVALGDSLTYGVGDQKGNGYVGDLEALLSQKHDEEVKIHNHGIPGQQSDGLLHQLNNEGDVKDDVEQADYIILFIGTNDLVKTNGNQLAKLHDKRIRLGQADYEKNLKVILKMVREKNPKAPILFLGLYNPYPSSEKVEKVIEDWNDTSEKIVSDYSRIKFISTNHLFKEKSTKYFSDALHPNKNGYKLITKKIVEEYDF